MYTVSAYCKEKQDIKFIILTNCTISPDRWNVHLHARFIVILFSIVNYVFKCNGMWFSFVICIMGYSGLYVTSVRWDNLLSTNERLYLLIFYLQSQIHTNRSLEGPRYSIVFAQSDAENDDRIKIFEELLEYFFFRLWP